MRVVLVGVESESVLADVESESGVSLMQKVKVV